LVFSVINLQLASEKQHFIKNLFNQNLSTSNYQYCSSKQ
jgi:hypothetical protein